MGDALACIEVHLAAALDKIFGVLVESLAALRFGIDDIQGSLSSQTIDHRDSGGEDKSTCGIDEPLDGIAGRRDKTARAAQGLGKGSHVNINIVQNPFFVRDTQTPRPQTRQKRSLAGYGINAF